MVVKITRVFLRIVLVDIDGTLCPIIDEWKRDPPIIGEDALTPEFVEKIRNITPYEWTFRRSWIGDVNIIVTGRCPGHEGVTMQWIRRWYGSSSFFIYKSVSRDKNDKPFNVRNVYVEKKSAKYTDLINAMRLVERRSCIPIRLEIYEDDVSVISGIIEVALDKHVIVHKIDARGNVRDVA